MLVRIIWAFVFLLLGPPTRPIYGARVDLSTLVGKHIAGYQGWFSCPQDGSGLGWRHWFRGDKPAVENLGVDMWPDTSELGPDELCSTGLTLRSGKPAYLYSSKNWKTVARHFVWMRNYGIDGVALERFASELKEARTRSFVNTVLTNVRIGAEATGRGFFIMYDLSGSDPEIADLVMHDWSELSQSLRPTNSPSYMRHRGKPVVGLWGLGVLDRPINAQHALTLIKFFHDANVPATVLAGTPAYWRTLEKDSHVEPEWGKVYRSVDVISPWTVGRFANSVEAKTFIGQTMIPDLAEVKRNGIDYMPVIFPGMSWYNGQEGRVSLNNIPRHCGRFYQNLARRVIDAGAAMLYTAMFDEVNEGTAIYKVAAQQKDTPVAAQTVTLDNDDCHVSSDFYLHLAGVITRALHRAPRARDVTR